MYDVWRYPSFKGRRDAGKPARGGILAGKPSNGREI